MWLSARGDGLEKPSSVFRQMATLGLDAGMVPKLQPEGGMDPASHSNLYTHGRHSSPPADRSGVRLAPA